MKRLLILVLTALLLAGCAPRENPQTLSVSLEEMDGVQVLNNGLQVRPGEDAVFQLVLEAGVNVVATDYPGEYELEKQDGIQLLRLRQVTYPGHIRLTVTSQFQTVTYCPNGGGGEPVTWNYDMRFHSRPNTLNGRAFQREGYTLVGWNTAPDGSGEQIGLGSRVSVPPMQTLELYAQWAKWSDEADFTWTQQAQGAVITGYRGDDGVLVIPARLGEWPVTGIAAGAFAGCQARQVILPITLKQVEAGAFVDCGLEALTLFDNIEAISDGCFANCGNLRTLHINAVEKPYGYQFRRESCLADKIDLLILNQGRKKLVCYGGCSMWYNLDGWLAQELLGEQYRVVNVGINGVINSAAQLQIITSYLEPGDVFFHTPEFSSKTQLMEVVELTEQDEKLWCGLEYNYDLVARLDLRQFPDLLDSLHHWLEVKKQTSSYEEHYVDGQGRPFFDPLGGIPFDRPATEGELVDEVCLDPQVFTRPGMARLKEYYTAIREKGVAVYVSYAAVNMDVVPEEQQGNVELMEAAFEAAFGPLPVTVISRLDRYLYRNEDYFDTNYHLIFEAAQRNTRAWMEDLIRQLQEDGRWE